MSSDAKKKLLTLLDYWIAHNVEHGQEFREWAEQAGALGGKDAGEGILKAAEAMDAASARLREVKNKLG